MPFRVSILSDEIGEDLEYALDVARGWGLRHVELRMTWGKNVVDLAPGEVDRVRRALESRGFSVECIAAPTFKVPLRDEGSERDSPCYHAARPGPRDQLEVLERALAVAGALGARSIRAFSFRRLPWSEEVRDEVASYLRHAANFAVARGCMLVVENEQTCNAATGAELGSLLAVVAQPNCKALWDPGNAHLAGEMAYPAGYLAIRQHVAGVHVKDCLRAPAAGDEPWRLLGEGEVDWRGQLTALVAAGYDGPLTLEPHPIPPYRREEAAHRCLQNLRQMLSVIEGRRGQDG